LSSSRHSKNRSGGKSKAPQKGSKTPGSGISRPDMDNLEKQLSGGRVLLVMACLSLVFTLPLVFNPGGRILGIYGNYYGDAFSGIWELWITKHSAFRGSSPLVIDMLAGPYASYFYSFLAAHKYLFFMIPFTAVLGPVISFNLFTIGNFVLAGFCTWLLARELTGSRLAAIISGIAFAFCPYMYAQAIVHMDVGATWPLPLVFYALLLFDRQRTARNAMFLTLALALFHCYCSIYYYLFIPLAAACYLLVRFANGYVYEFSAGRKRLERLTKISPGRWLAVGGIGVVLLTAGILAYKFYLGPLAAEQVRPLHWQERFKLSWANYLLPGVDHPWFGKITRDIVPVRRNVTESASYLGWVPLLLALWGFGSAKRDWRAWMLVIFGLVSLSFTLGPYLTFGYIRLPMPSLMLHKVAPFIRVISRYAVFVQLAVSVLAAYGALRIAGAVREKKLPAFVSALILLILAVEFFPPMGSTAVAGSPEEAPPVYRYLAGLEEDATVFEYPVCAMSGLAMGDQLYFQTIHRKRLFNRYLETTTIPKEYEPFWWDLDYPGALSDPNNVAALAFFGVDYLVFRDRTGTETPTLSLPQIENIEGLELLERFGNSAVYRVTAEPAKVLHAFDSRPLYNYLEIRRPVPELGFEAIQVLSDGRGWRIMHERGRLKLVNLLEEAQTVDLEVLALSFEKSRPVQLAVDRKLKLEFTVGTQPQMLKIPAIELPPKGEAELIFNSPEGVSSLPVRGGGNIEASIAVSALRVKTAKNTETDPGSGVVP
jgi:hypothetical protein